MVGDSPQMREVFDQIRKFAATDLPVIITGESGTGKELVGRAIHQRSRRSRMPYVALNCAAVPATLMASELFGYERGAFTGANTRKLGHVEHANGGSLFLDEIGDMPLDLQPLLLRFLQEGEILRVGGRDPIKIDARVIAATNVTLRDAIETGKLREDLYYRLNVLTLHLPPLRDREGDVELLATHCLRELALECTHELRGFSRSAMSALRSYPWPGNVRELIATIRRAVVMSNGPLIDEPDLRLERSRATVVLLAPPRRNQKAVPEVVRPPLGSDAERTAIVDALQRSEFVLSCASRALGVSRATMYRLMRRHQIELRPRYTIEKSSGESD